MRLMQKVGQSTGNIWKTVPIRGKLFDLHTKCHGWWKNKIAHHSENMIPKVTHGGGCIMMGGRGREGGQSLLEDGQR